MDKVNRCKGCCDACFYYKEILNKGTSNEIRCPCTTCLVKMMCNTACQPLSKFRYLSHYIMKKRKEKINVNTTTKRK